MIAQIPPMNKQPKNLFPETIRKGAIEIFGEHSIQPVLLGLLPAPTDTGETKPDACLPEMLHPNEAAILAGYRLPKRRSEYLTGRICAKMAVQSFLSRTKFQPIPMLLPEIEITSEENGRPDVRFHKHRPKTNMPQMDISISHSGDYGAALAAGSRCGIDLQMKKEALLRVQEKYCSTAEYRLLETILPNNDKITRLTILWAAKEAAKKALSHWRMPGFLDLELRQLKNSKNYMVLSLYITNTNNSQVPEKITAVTGMSGDYALAICLVSKESSNAGTPRS